MFPRPLMTRRPNKSQLVSFSRSVSTMGKAKSAKKGRQPQTNAPIPKAGTTSVTALEADLASLEEGKRQKACMLLADLYQFNISNKFSLDTLTSANILSKLSMRLVDTSDKVRVQASSALKNLSESKDAAIVKRLVSLGIVRSVVTLFTDASASASWSNADVVEFVENLLHTVANALSCNAAAMNEILSTNADFIVILTNLINTSIPSNVVSAVANLLIIVAGNGHADLILSNDASSTFYRTRLDGLWNFIEALNTLKGAALSDITNLGLFSLQVSTSRASKTCGSDSEEYERYAFQINVLISECLEVVISLYTHAQLTAELAQVCRLPRALQLLHLELHSSLNGIEVTSSSASSIAGAVDADMDMDETDMTDAVSELGGPEMGGLGGPKKASVNLLAPEVAANMRRLGLCKTIAGVISSLLEALTSEADMSHADSAAQRHQKRAVLSQALLELQSFPNLLQCYNAAYYFVTNSTAPRPVTAVGTAVCSDNNSIMSTVDPQQQNATVEMAITPAVLEGLDCCEQLASTLALTLAVTAAAHPLQLRDAGMVDVSQFLKLLDPLLVLVTQTTPVIDGAAKDWKAPYFVESGVTENGFRRSLLACTSSLIEFVTQCIKLAGAPNHRAFVKPTVKDTTVPVILSWSDDQLKNLSLLLLKGSNFPNVEVSVPAVLAMGALGQRDFALRDACNAAEVAGTPAGAGEVGLLSPNVNGLLTNAVLNRLRNPNAYASDTTQLDKAQRLIEGKVQLMDSCFNAVIDLHTSDITPFLEKYHRLQCANQLQEHGEAFQALVESPASKLDVDDRAKFRETLENLQNFLEYKATFNFVN